MKNYKKILMWCIVKYGGSFHNNICSGSEDIIEYNGSKEKIYDYSKGTCSGTTARGISDHFRG